MTTYNASFKNFLSSFLSSNFLTNIKRNFLESKAFKNQKSLMSVNVIIQYWKNTNVDPF